MRILVVGGAGGIGAAIANKHGDRATVWSRRSGVDATDERQVRAAARRYLDQHGPPWALVHAVGDFEERPLLETDTELWSHLLHSNLTSAFFVTRAIVPAMSAAGRGRVLLFAAAGTDTRRAMRRAPVYFAVKAALLQLARSLAAEAAPSGVTVNVLSPGIIRHPDSHTESQDRMESKVPMGRSGTPEDLMGVVDLLLSEQGGYITGQDIAIDGGLSL